jgi:hypothetical protein
MVATQSAAEKKLYALALALAIFTIIYNLAEGMISGIGIMHMVLRIRKDPAANRDTFERTALRITGTAFYLLVAGLLLSAGIIIYTGQKPETTLWGVIISLISIVVMLVLIFGKIKVGKKLNSESILADANCTKVCIYMSVILLLSSGIYELTHLPYIDAAGTLGLAWFSYKEGQECFEKAAGNLHCGCDHD